MKKAILIKRASMQYSMNNEIQTRGRNDHSSGKYSDFHFVHYWNHFFKEYPHCFDFEWVFLISSKNNKGVIINILGIQSYIVFRSEIWFHMVALQIQTSKFLKHFVATTMIMRTSAGPELPILARSGKLKRGRAGATKWRQSWGKQLVSHPSFGVESVPSARWRSQCCRQPHLWTLAYHLSSRRCRFCQPRDSPSEVPRDHHSSPRAPAQQGYVWAWRHDEFDHGTCKKMCRRGSWGHGRERPIQEACWRWLPLRFYPERPRQQQVRCPSFHLCQFDVVATQPVRPRRRDVTRWRL